MKAIQGENGDLLIESIDNDDDVVINGLIQGIENEEPMQIEGFFSFIKKAVKKVSKIGKIANKFGLLPPGAGFGLDMLNKLAGSSKTRKKVKFSAGATRDVYKAAFLKGYAKGLRKVELYVRKSRR